MDHVDVFPKVDVRQRLN